MEDGTCYSFVQKHRPVTIDNDIRPISLTLIIAKVFESLVLKWVNVYVKPQIDDKQYGEMAATCNNTIINNSICLRRISSNKTIQRRITLYRNIHITLKNRDVVVK